VYVVCYTYREFQQFTKNCMLINCCSRRLDGCPEFYVNNLGIKLQKVLRTTEGWRFVIAEMKGYLLIDLGQEGIVKYQLSRTS